MKRPALALVVVLAVIFIIFRFCNNKPEEVADPKQSPLAISENSGVFNRSYQQLLSSYYALTGAFVVSDTAKINAASQQLQQSADSLKVSEIRGDTSGAIKETAKYYAGTIGGSAGALVNEKDVQSKRKDLNIITDALWSLTRTVKYDGQRVYYNYCPMALSNKGAYWLNDKPEIRNPYFGGEMLTCGEVADSLDYSKR